MSIKKLINHPQVIVDEMVDGLVSVYPGLMQLPGENVVIRSDVEQMRARQVALISGGGSGHEPAHIGYVGAGMLSAAVAGAVFTSPSVDAILATIRAVTGKAGTLLIVKNYTGDRLNFGLAAELARAEGLNVEMILIADDVALAQTTSKAGRRGIAGTVLVHKVAGAAADAGASLAQVVTEAKAAAAVLGTMGVALSPAIIPATGKSSFELGDDEIELGLGIHGEAGARRTSMLSVRELVKQLLDSVLHTCQIPSGERVVLLVNNLGGSTTMELGIVAREAVEYLKSQEFLVERTYMGTFLSALDMAGVSLSLMIVDDQRLARLDAPTLAPAWSNVIAQTQDLKESKVVFASAQNNDGFKSGEPQTPLGLAIKSALVEITQALIEAEPRLTDIDHMVGDGDLGISLERGSRAIQSQMSTYPFDDAAATLQALSQILRKSLGGSSGPLYAIFLLRAAYILEEKDALAPSTWADAFMAGCMGISELGGAQLGECTMLDALIPAAETLQTQLAAGESLSHAFGAAVNAAKLGADSTAELVAQQGRSSYMGERALGVPDPGAVAVTIWLVALQRVLS
jgi:dihydroxyacetone kinase